MTAKPANTTPNHGKGRTAEDAATRTDGNRAVIRIPVDSLPDAPEPTLPRKGVKAPSYMSAWFAEHKRKQIDEAEKKRHRRAKI